MGMYQPSCLAQKSHHTRPYHCSKSAKRFRQTSIVLRAPSCSSRFMLWFQVYWNTPYWPFEIGFRCRRRDTFWSYCNRIPSHWLSDWVQGYLHPLRMGLDLDGVLGRGMWHIWKHVHQWERRNGCRDTEDESRSWIRPRESCAVVCLGLHRNNLFLSPSKEINVTLAKSQRQESRYRTRTEDVWYPVVRRFDLLPTVSSTTADISTP